jgi:hypothetical protein
MTTIFSNGNTSNTYTVPSAANILIIEAEGSAGGKGGDGADDEGVNGSAGGKGGYVKAELSVSGGETFTINIGEGGGDGGNGDVGSSVSNSGGSGGLSPNNNGGSGSGGQKDSSYSSTTLEGVGGAGGGGGGETRIIRDSDASIIAIAEGGGGGKGGITKTDDDEAFGGGGGGGARGGSGGCGSISDVYCGEDGEGTGDGGNGGDTSSSQGGSGGQQTHSDLTNITTQTGGSDSSSSGIVKITEHVTWPTPDLTVSNITNTSVNLTWNDADFETEYTVEYRFTGGSWNDYSTLPSGTINETVNGLDEGREYEFRVTALNSETSESESATTTTILPAPNNLSIISVTDTTASLSWSVQSVDENGVRVYRKISGGNFSEISDLPNGTESYTDSSLLNGREYSYFCEVYTEDVTESSNIKVDTTVINNPINLQDVSDTRNVLDVDWDSDLNNGNFYIEFERLSDNTVVETNSISYTTTEDSISGVSDGIEYEIRVRSETDDVTGNYTSIQTNVFIPHSRFLDIKIDGDERIELQWEKIDSNNSGSYEIYRSQQSGNIGSKIDTVSYQDRTYIDTNVDTMKEYYYTIRRVI